MVSDPGEIVVRAAEPSDTDAVVAFLGLCLGPGSVPRSDRFWHWKHELNPFGPSPVMLAQADGEIVGLRAFLRWRWRSGERAVEAVRAVDTATHPEWRGRGIFTRLTLGLVEQERERGTGFVFNTPNRASGPGYLKMGWRSVGVVPLLARPGQPGAVLRRRVPGSRFVPAVDGFPSVSKFLDLPWAQRFLEGIEEARCDRRLRTEVSLPYLRWRYCQVPGIRYRVAWSGPEGAAAAVIFRSRSRSRFHELSVTEILSAEDPAAVRAASRLLRGLARSSGADFLVAVASPRTPERSAARRAGFLPVPRAGPALFVRELSGGTHLPELTRRGNWRLATGTLEVF